jgi:hypothetical protein
MKGEDIGDLDWFRPDMQHSLNELVKKNTIGHKDSRGFSWTCCPLRSCLIHTSLQNSVHVDLMMMMMMIENNIFTSENWSFVEDCFKLSH